jgi:hypothetical protein
MRFDLLMGLILSIMLAIIVGWTALNVDMPENASRTLIKLPEGFAEPGPNLTQTTASTTERKLLVSGTQLNECRKIKNPLTRGSCYMKLKGKLPGDIGRRLDICRSMDNKLVQDECLNDLADYMDNQSITAKDNATGYKELDKRLTACANRGAPELRDECYEAVAEAEGLERICDYVSDADAKWRCYSLTLRDSTLCYKIKNQIMKATCVRDLSGRAGADCTAPLKP